LKKKKTILKIIIFLILINAFTIKSFATQVSAQSAIVIEAKSRKIIFAKNENKILQMASTTKIMTALTVIEEYPDLEKIVAVPQKAANTEGSSMYLKANEKISVKSLLYGLMLVSGNDAANTLALTLGENEENFVNKMNEKAKEIGLKDTNFKNPSGLPNEEHFTTAKELSLIAARAMENETFCQIVKTKSIHDNNRTLVNHNKLLSLYDSCIGIKTGFTKTAGRCLVSAAQKDGITLIAVTLNAPDDWNDHINMFNESFDKTQRITLLKPNELSYEIDVGGGIENKVRVTNTQEATAVIVDNENNFETKVLLPSFVFAPLEKGAQIGAVEYYQEGKLVFQVPLCTQDEVKAAKKPPFSRRFILALYDIFNCI